jgi:energy-coupling factor transporter ATP-binding protein EcfA2
VLNKIKALLVKCAHAEFDADGGGNQVENYHTVAKDLQEAENRSRQIETQRSTEIAKLRDESRYMNRYLKRLGVHHFEIVMARQKMGDNIRIQYRSGTARSKLRHSLSESEKTTLAFAYFLSKIQYEVIDNNKASLADTLIVIDDPVSSLDENRLHVTACLIDELFRDAKQLFVLSHNVIFMKFLSNVLGNVTVRARGEDKVSGRRDYYLCAHTGKVLELPRQLRNYRTTYFQRVNELLQYSKGSISYEEAKAFLPNRIRTGWKHS